MNTELCRDSPGSSLQLHRDNAAHAGYIAAHNLGWVHDAPLQADVGLEFAEILGGQADGEGQEM